MVLYYINVKTCVAFIKRLNKENIGHANELRDILLTTIKLKSISVIQFLCSNREVSQDMKTWLIDNEQKMEEEGEEMQDEEEENDDDDDEEDDDDDDDDDDEEDDDEEEEDMISCPKPVCACTATVEGPQV